jgi:hypothetical protein
MRTNCWTHTSVSMMQTCFMRSMEPTAWSSLGNLPTHHGTRGNL